jgi:hypothetical protein
MPRKRSVAQRNVLRPQVDPRDLANAYREMAADEAREGEAHAWAEATLGDLAEEVRRGPRG